MAPKRSTRDTHPAPGTTTSAASKPAGKPRAAEPQTLGQIARGVWRDYTHLTPQRTKLVDVFLVFLVAVGALQFLYCIIAGNYPFNAFLSGFSATVGQFVLTASLRVQTSKENEAEFKKVSPERAFADFVFGSLILHFLCVNFIN